MTAIHRTFVRFVHKVAFAGECWLWTGATPIPGHQYGQFRDEHSNRVQAHRWSYEFFVGPIPDGLYVDHLCRNEACVNPQHLQPVTLQENCLRGSHIVPCVHGGRARSHCKACTNEYLRDRARIRRGNIRTNERLDEPCIAVGAQIPSSMVASLDALVIANRLNRSAIIRRALEMYISHESTATQEVQP